MVTDGVNVLSVRSRTTRSSKGKASQSFSLFLHFPNIFLSLLTPSSLSHVLSLSSIFFSSFNSSSPTQKQTHNSSRNNSVTSAYTRLTQPATEIAFSVLSLTSCTAPNLAIFN
jgi:hypothetical protein